MSSRALAKARRCKHDAFQFQISAESNSRNSGHREVSGAPRGTLY